MKEGRYLSSLKEERDRSTTYEYYSALKTEGKPVIFDNMGEPGGNYTK